MEMSCRLCAGIADPGVCLLDPAHQRLAACAQNNLNITIAADNDYPTQICTSCADGLRRWMMFRERAEKAHGKFQKTLKPPSDVTVAPFLPQSGGEASPDTCSVAVRTGTAEQTSRQPSQAMENIGPEIRPARTFLDKWLRPSQTLKLPVVTKSSTNRAVRTNSSQENLVAKFCLKDLRVCVARLSEKLLASLQQAKAGPAAGQKKVGCSLPQATETASPKSASVTSTRSVGDAATNQQTSSCGQELSDSSSAARKAVCGGGQLTVEGTSLLSLPDTDGDTRADVQSTARPGLLPARHKTPRRSPGDEEDGRAKSRELDDRDKGSRQRSDVGAPCEISLPKLNFNQDEEKRFSCGQCTKVFERKCYLAYHINNKHKSVPDLYKCKLCGAAFKFLRKLTDHMKISAHSDLKTISCDQCDLKFKFRSLLKIHIETHNNGARSYKCTLCDGSYKTKQSLYVHKKYYHGNSKYICSVCSKRFKYSNCLKDHIERWHSKGVRPYKCDLCGAMTKTKIDLCHHKFNIHSSIKKHVCSFCKKKFKTLSKLKLHIERLHTNGPRLQCDQCTSTSKTRQDLAQHKQRVHSGLIFTCDVCKKECKNKQSLKVHIVRTHISSSQKISVI